MNKKNGNSRHAYFNFSRPFYNSKNIFLLDKGIDLSLIHYKTCLVQFIVGNNSKNMNESNVEKLCNEIDDNFIFKAKTNKEPVSTLFGSTKELDINDDIFSTIEKR